MTIMLLPRDAKILAKLPEATDRAYAAADGRDADSMLERTTQYTSVVAHVSARIRNVADVAESITLCVVY